jgi:hypothetical protein
MNSRYWIGLVLMVMGAPLAVAQQDLSKVVIESQKVAEGVYMLTGAGGNLGASIGEDGIVLIDDQFAELTPRIQEALAKRATAVRPRHQYALALHRVGGNESGKTGSIIVAHDSVRQRRAFLLSMLTPHAGIA